VARFVGEFARRRAVVRSSWRMWAEQARDRQAGSRDRAAAGRRVADRGAAAAGRAGRRGGRGGWDSRYARRSALAEHASRRYRRGGTRSAWRSTGRFTVDGKGRRCSSSRGPRWSITAPSSWGAGEGLVDRASRRAAQHGTLD